MLNTLYLILEQPNEHRFGKGVQLLIFSVILISTLSLFLETVSSLKEYQVLFNTIEQITMMLFTIEIFLRFLSIYNHDEYQGVNGKLKFFTNPFIIIDLIVLIPYYFSFFGIDFLFLRVLRVLRIFKLFRHTKYDQFDDTILQILKENKSKFIVIFVISAILVFVTAPIMYYFERVAQPEVFSSIPAALWWTTVTFTTVGYGDMYPVTSLGKILATLVSVLGIAFYAIPGSIFTSALLDKIKQERENRK